MFGTTATSGLCLAWNRDQVAGPRGKTEPRGIAKRKAHHWRGARCSRATSGQPGSFSSSTGTQTQRGSLPSAGGEHRRDQRDSRWSSRHGCRGWIGSATLPPAVLAPPGNWTRSPAPLPAQGSTSIPSASGRPKSSQRSPMRSLAEQWIRFSSARPRRTGSDLRLTSSGASGAPPDSPSGGQGFRRNTWRRDGEPGSASLPATAR